jgi:hypothetical protein
VIFAHTSAVISGPKCFFQKAAVKVIIKLDIIAPSPDDPDLSPPSGLRPI